MEDWLLLRKYLEEGSEAAFRELMSRHLDLVYATALRRLGNAPAAEDVTQSVFCLLARKASQLRPEGSLMGWLYQTACFMASKHQESEFRRHRREQEAMQTYGNDNAPEVHWERIAPVLDEAMQRLPEPERNLLLLRFFKGTPLQEVGRSVGISEDAARMRINRSLEKLRDLLKQRGIASTTAALAAILGEKAVEAAPSPTSLAIQNAVLRTMAAASVPSVTNTVQTLMKQSPYIAALVTGMALLLAFIVVIHFYNRFEAIPAVANAALPPTFTPAHKDEAANHLFPRFGARTNDANKKKAKAGDEDVPAQVNIEAKFIELSASAANSITLLKSDSYQVRILSDEKARDLISKLDAQKGVDVLYAPNVITLSGRQAHVASTVERSILSAESHLKTTNYPFGNPLVSEITYVPTRKTGEIITNQISTGISLDVIPYVKSGDIIQLTHIPNIIQFLGYEDVQAAGEQNQKGASKSEALESLPIPRLQILQSEDKITIRSKQFALCGPIYFDKLAWEPEEPQPNVGADTDNTDAPKYSQAQVEAWFKERHRTKTKQAIYVLTTACIIDAAGNAVNFATDSSADSDSQN